LEAPEIAREIVARGHVIGNHTDTHPNLFWVGPSRIAAELRACQDTIADTIGVQPKWFRPPYGYRNPWVIPAATELECRTAMWTLIPGDWRPKSTEWLIDRMAPIAERARRNSGGEKQIPRASLPQAGKTALGMTSEGSERGTEATGDILCLHDGYHRQLNADRTHTLAALEHWLPRWRDLGLEFVTMEEAVSKPAA